VRRSVVVVSMCSILSTAAYGYATDGPPSIRGMWNPLMLPALALGAAADAIRLLRSLPHALSALEQGLARLDRLTARGNALLEELQRTRELLEAGREDLAAATRRAHEEAVILRGLIADARPSSERIAELVEPVVKASAAAREQLERTQEQLVAVSLQVERMLEMTQASEPASPAEPPPPPAPPAEPEPEPKRRGRIAGAFRRNSPAAG
jgi:methyl-accepting chemotaxis protein